MLLVYISEMTPTNVKVVTTYLSPSQSDISNNTADMEFIKNNNTLVKVIGAEDQSTRSVGKKVIDIATLDTVTNQSCNDYNRCSNKDTFTTESSGIARFNVVNTPVGK